MPVLKKSVSIEKIIGGWICIEKTYYQRIKNENFEQPKKVKVTPLRFFRIHSVAKYQNIERGPSKIFEKNLTKPKQAANGPSTHGKSAQCTKSGPIALI